MADVSDVYNALTALIQQTLYPAGAPVPGQVSPVIGTSCRYYPGWPQKAQLDADIAAGIVNVSVFAGPMERNTTRYPLDWQQSAPPVHTLTATVDATGTEATIGGTVSTPQNVALLVDGIAVSYGVKPTDTLASIAAGLAALLTAAGVSAAAAGAVVTVAGAHGLVARVGGQGAALMEVMRVQQRFRVSFWCPTPALRDAASSAVKAAVAQLNFLTLADGTGARIVTTGDAMIDESAKAVIYRRDLTYAVEYATTITEPATEIIVLETQLSGGLDLNEPPLLTTYQ